MITLAIEFDEDLKKQLKYIDRNLVNKSTMAALRKIAKPVLMEVKANAPQDTMVLKHALSASSTFNKKAEIGVVYVGLSKKNHPGWLITRGLAMEYGNRHVDPQPFLTPTSLENRGPVLSEFTGFFNHHLDKLIAKAS